MLPVQRNAGGGPSSVPCVQYRLFDGHSFELKQRAIGQGGHLETGTGQGLSDKVVGVDSINGGEVADIDQEDRGLSSPSGNSPVSKINPSWPEVYSDCPPAWHDNKALRQQ